MCYQTKNPTTRHCQIFLTGTIELKGKLKKTKRWFEFSFKLKCENGRLIFSCTTHIFAPNACMEEEDEEEDLYLFRVSHSGNLGTAIDWGPDKN